MTSPKIIIKEKLNIVEHRLMGKLAYKNMRPIVVTGSHRSGTTLTGLIIAEDTNTRWLYEIMNPEHAYLADNRRCLVCGLLLDRDYQYPPDRNAHKLRRHYKHHLNAKAYRKKIPLVKDPFSLLMLEWLEQEFGARPVVMLRNPVSFVGSIKETGWTLRLEDIVDQTNLMTRLDNKTASSIRRGLKKPLDLVDNTLLMWEIFYQIIEQYQKEHPDWYYLKLEDLASQPMAEAEKLFKHLGLDFTDTVKSKVAELTDKSNPAEATKGVTHSMHRNSKASLETWKKRLSTQEVGYITNKLSPRMLRFYPELKDL